MLNKMHDKQSFEILGPTHILIEAVQHLVVYSNKTGWPTIFNSLVAHDKYDKRVKAMFTLYKIGFCSLSKVAPVQCEQVSMFCFGAEIVPKNSLSVLQFAIILF